MQVILLEKISNLGNLGDVVKVKDGFARNFLIPTKRARRATETAITEFEGRRAELEKAAADKLTAAQALSEKIAVTNFDIAEGLKNLGLSIQKSQIRLPNGPLKTVGDHAVSVAPHTDVVVDITVRVVAETE